MTDYAESAHRKIRRVYRRSTIMTDRGRSCPFNGEIKTYYVGKLAEALHKTEGFRLQVCVEAGRLLSEVKPRLKKHRLYNQFLRDLDLSRSTAHNYVRLWVAFGESLPRFFHLSMRKLVVIAAAANDPCLFCRENEEMILKTSLEDLRKIFKQGPQRQLSSDTVGKAEPHPAEAIPDEGPNDAGAMEEFNDLGGSDERERSTRWTFQHQECPNKCGGIMLEESDEGRSVAPDYPSLQNRPREMERQGHGILVTIASGAVFVMALIMILFSGSLFWPIENASRDDQIIRAVEKCDVKEVVASLKAGADVDARDTHGVTPLMKACLSDDYKTAKVLLERGANANAKDMRGETALMAASLNGNSRIVQLLLECGAEVNARSRNGQTALYRAERARQWKVRQLMIRAGGRH